MTFDKCWELFIVASGWSDAPAVREVFTDEQLGAIKALCKDFWEHAQVVQREACAVWLRNWARDWRGRLGSEAGDVDHKRVAEILDDYAAAIRAAKETTR